MKTSQNGINLIKKFEGCGLSAYRCPSGVWTIGYGHTAGVKQGQKITQAQADAFLQKDITLYENYVRLTGLSLNQNQFDALVSFTFNCGAGNLSKLIKNRNLTQIAEALLLYNKDANGVSQGLVARRKAERELFLSGNLGEKATSPTPLYNVITTSDLNIREGAGIEFEKIGLAKKGTILKVWAEKTSGASKWGKNEIGFFNLAYTKRL